MKPRIQILFFSVLSSLIGCAHPVSEEARRGLDPSITFERLLEAPEEFIGKRLLLGGVIVVTRNLPDGTEVEVVQKEVDFTGYPEAGDQTGGRFIFFNKGFLEPEIYSKGRGITGVGKVRGTKMGMVGERAYEFPVIEAEELKLLDDVERNPYFYPPYWDPWYRPHSYAPYWPYYQ